MHVSSNSASAWFERLKAALGLGSLVLSRRRDEFVGIFVPPSKEEQEIYVSIADVRENKVRLAFVAERKVKILRSEHLYIEDEE